MSHVTHVFLEPAIIQVTGQADVRRWRYMQNVLFAPHKSYLIILTLTSCVSLTGQHRVTNTGCASTVPLTGKLELLYPSMSSPKPSDSFDKNKALFPDKPHYHRRDYTQQWELISGANQQSCKLVRWEETAAQCQKNPKKQGADWWF